MKKFFLTISIIVFVFTFSAICFAQQRGVGNTKENQTSEKRLALVIGNGAYQKTDALPNPVNDATDMAQALNSLGFEVISGTNQTKQQMENLIRQFGNRLADTKAVGLFFYAGHGISSGGANYLIPVDADIQAEDEVEYSSVTINFVLNKMSAAKNGLNIVILDACRNNPFARKWRNYRDIGDIGGLVKITPPTGTIMLYATQPGNVASDGKERNGLFTESLLKQIKRPNIELDAMIKFLASDVANKSNNQQLPWREGIILGDFYFAGKNMSNIVPNSSSDEQPAKLANSSGDQAFWQEAEKRNTILMYETYISNYPKGEFVPLANFKIQEITAKAKSFFDEAIKLPAFGNSEKALELYTKAIELNPNYELAYYGRGSVFYEASKFDESIADFTKTIEINPQNASAYYHRSGVLYKKNQNNKALEDINKCLKFPGFSYSLERAYLLRGQIYTELGKYDLAINDFNESLRLSGSISSFAYSVRGIAYLKKQEYDLAINDFTRSLLDAEKFGYSDIWSEYFRTTKSVVFDNRGKAYLGKRDYNLAIADFTKVIESSLEPIEAYENRALAYEAVGNKTQANTDRQKAAELKKKQKK